MTFETSKTYRAPCHRDILQAWQVTCCPIQLFLACHVLKLWLDVHSLESQPLFLAAENHYRVQNTKWSEYKLVGFQYQGA